MRTGLKTSVPSETPENIYSRALVKKYRIIFFDFFEAKYKGMRVCLFFLTFAHV